MLQNIIRCLKKIRCLARPEDPKLEHKCFERGRTLIRISEAYTSKTNSFTGEQMTIGSRESFVHDGIRINRDINGARNILLRALVDSPLSESVRIEQKGIGIC